MENQVVDAPALNKTPEQIEAEMFETRESLTEKVAALENQVLGTVQTAANTITDTVDAVKSFVNTAPETVRETVEQVTTAVREQVARTFDITNHVQSNPLTSVGVSVGIGFIAGYLVFGRDGSSVSRSESPRRMAESAHSAPSSPPPREPREPGVLDSLFSSLGQKVKEMAMIAIDAASASVSSNIRENIPKLVELATQRLVSENNGTHGEPLKNGGHFYGR